MWRCLYRGYAGSVATAQSTDCTRGGVEGIMLEGCAGYSLAGEDSLTSCDRHRMSFDSEAFAFAF